MNKNSKINTVDKVMMSILVVSADTGEILADLGIAIPVIGPVLPAIAWFYGFTISIIMIFWLIMKGVSIKWFLGGSGIDLIPVINGLPAKSAALLATFIEDSLPEKAKSAPGAVTGKPKIK